jgi:hypothetical protein
VTVADVETGAQAGANVWLIECAATEDVAETSPSRHIVLDTDNGTDESTRRLIYEVFAHTIAA